MQSRVGAQRTSVENSNLAFGEPPHAYVVRRRLERACHLMVTSAASLSEIALERRPFGSSASVQALQSGFWSKSGQLATRTRNPCLDGAISKRYRQASCLGGDGSDRAGHLDHSANRLRPKSSRVPGTWEAFAFEGTRARSRNKDGKNVLDATTAFKTSGLFERHIGPCENWLRSSSGWQLRRLSSSCEP